ncbi:hypothetical protein JCGZ_25693 [Jatropha curcas]|uniref:Uncharacterized protein n=1 Tax=Jatropha curcas TaxID=180498 RepID=A0A067LRE0_JATCU|nr:hypothetical protein JCGZ_25693 [Jatropha curcas]
MSVSKYCTKLYWWKFALIACFELALSYTDLLIFALVALLILALAPIILIRFDYWPESHDERAKMSHATASERKGVEERVVARGKRLGEPSSSGVQVTTVQLNSDIRGQDFWC